MAEVKITPSPEELDLYQGMLNEASYMGGTPIKYLAVKKALITGVSSEVYEWEDPIDVDGIYQERPKISFLRRLNWFKEDSDIQPQVLFLPIKQGDKELLVKRGALIKIKSMMNPNEENTFQVSEVRTDIVPLTFVCNLVPYREQHEKASEPTANNVWLNNAK